MTGRASVHSDTRSEQRDREWSGVCNSLALVRLANDLSRIWLSYRVLSHLVVAKRYVPPLADFGSEQRNGLFCSCSSSGTPQKPIQATEPPEAVLDIIVLS